MGDRCDRRHRFGILPEGNSDRRSSIRGRSHGEQVRRQGGGGDGVGRQRRVPPTVEDVPTLRRRGARNDGDSLGPRGTVRARRPLGPFHEGVLRQNGRRQRHRRANREERGRSLESHGRLERIDGLPGSSRMFLRGGSTIGSGSARSDRDGNSRWHRSRARFSVSPVSVARVGGGGDIERRRRRAIDERTTSRKMGREPDQDS
mmetsp:Transcript_27609/g.81194  ORF Transcript_27609/g.81194 Transcript_27609/m.81194 type:complete len:203 (-) Transcript_27609:525-1133(-)